MRPISILENLRGIIQNRKNRFAGAEKTDMGNAFGQKTAETAAEDGVSRGIRQGRLEIPEGTEEIPERRYDRVVHRDADAFTSVYVPGTVRRIGSRAFGNCADLEEVILCEGVEIIENNAFTGCTKLKQISLPGSIKQIDGGAFYKSGLERPVISADGRIFIYYPQAWENEEYSIPEGVEEIAPRAFIDREQLMKLNLPRSLKRIHSRAFYSCGFRELQAPGDTEIGDNAFAYFEHMVRVLQEREQTPLQERMECCRMNGASFMSRRRMKPPADQYWKRAEFRSLARECGAGSGEAMERMADFFLAKEKEKPEEVFYSFAADFWRVRAGIYGSAAAEQYLNKWCIGNPDRSLSAPCIDEKLQGSADGAALNALGFLFFEENREYSLSGVDQDGVVEVSSWESEEGPDSDGFGREEFYDWWYLDEHLSQPEGVGYIHSYSHNDKRCNEEKFRDLHDRAAALKKRI